MRTTPESPATEPEAQPFRPFGGFAAPETPHRGQAAPTDGPAGASQAAELAHDINNLLTVILSCAGELREVEGSPGPHPGVEEIIAAADRGAVLTRELIDDARPTGTGPAGPLDVAASLAEAAPAFRHTAGPGIRLELETEAGLPRALCPVADLERSLLNLIANARDAMPGGGELRIAACRVAVGLADPVLSPGWYVRIDVADSGSGMSPHLLRRVADPWFSTKAGRGSGLGLPAVFGAARAAGGDARISSAPGRGTTVSLLLRAARRDGTPLALGRA